MNPKLMAVGYSNISRDREKAPAVESLDYQQL